MLGELKLLNTDSEEIFVFASKVTCSLLNANGTFATPMISPSTSLKEFISRSMGVMRSKYCLDHISSPMHQILEYLYWIACWSLMQHCRNADSE